jgi:excisionase family DNA binding protein
MVPVSFTLGLRIGMGAKVRVQLGLSTAIHKLPHPTTPAPGGPPNLSTVVHGSGLTWLLLCENLWPEVVGMTEHRTRLLKVADAAETLAISKSQLYKLISVGAIRAVKVGPQGTRVLWEDVERLAREGVPRAVIQLLRRRGGGGCER